jgi:hypothetical protein
LQGNGITPRVLRWQVSRWQELTDAVEKVGRESQLRNNRIERACNSNQRCASDWIFESKLRGDALKIFFQHYRPTPDSRPENMIAAQQPKRC